MTNKIKALLIDGGNILFEDSKQKNELFDYLKSKNFIADKEDEIPKETSSFSNINEEKFKKIYNKYKTKAQTIEGYERKDAYKDTLKELMIEKYYNDLMNYINQNKKSPKVIPGVKEVLEQIAREGIKIIVLTDATKHGYELQESLKKIGYGSEISDIISSKDVHVCKPDAKFFETALKKHGLKKDEVIFIGHDTDELVGAHKLKYKTVAFRYANKDLSQLKDISYKINEPSELLKIIFEDENEKI